MLDEDRNAAQGELHAGHVETHRRDIDGMHQHAHRWIEALRFQDIGAGEDHVPVDYVAARAFLARFTQRAMTPVSARWGTLIVR